MPLTSSRKRIGSAAIATVLIALLIALLSSRKSAGDGA